MPWEKLIGQTVILALFVAAGCPGAIDEDGDGWVAESDCNDNDPTIHPEAEELCDGEDNDCDGSPGADEVDADSDGVMLCQDDCDDNDDTSYPGADEICDGYDNDCNGSPGNDEADGDTDGQMICEGDCDDSNPDVYDGASEAGACEDGYDNDCDGFTDELDTDDCSVDADGDGFSDLEGDCDDADATVYPGATELCDGLDNDCDEVVPDDEADSDTDGYMECEGDCDDSEPLAYPGASEDCDGVADNDCDGTDDELELDGDGDGVTECDGDCDDAESARYPGNTEVCDGLDNDCDEVIPADETDDDGDGYSECADSDCDDADASSYPGAVELCDGVDNDCAGGPDADEVDSDGDGQMVCAGDCDDGNTAVYLGAAETCDGVADNSCDGTDDPDEIDDDGDGVNECDNDCDDGDAARFPGNPEICDGLDNDCDESLPADETDGDGDGSMVCGGDCDDGNPYLSGTDFDGDGFSTCDDDCNDADATLDPADLDGDGFSTCDSDCDDGDPSRYLGASEDCDGVDNDCDLIVPADETDDDYDGLAECEGDCDDSDASLNADDADFDGFTTCEGDCDDFSSAYNPLVWDQLGDGQDLNCDGTDGVDADGDGVASEVSGGTDCDDADGTTYPGADEGCNGIDNDCDQALDPLEIDDDGDGVAECEGDCDDADAGVNPSAAEWCDGIDNNCDDVTDPGCAPIGLFEVANAPARLLGEASGDQAGASLSHAGDVDGDGYADILIGATHADSNGVDSGTAYVVHGPISGDVDLATANARMVGGGSNYNAGTVSTAGDVNGDGLDDILVGARKANSSGRAYLVLSPVSGTDTLDALAHATFTGEQGDSLTGSAVASAGDVDADGEIDFIIGALYYDNGGNEDGAAYVVLGPVSGSYALSGSEARILGGQDDHLGQSVAGIGDFDGDGYDDVAIGAPAEHQGYIVSGPVSGNGLINSGPFSYGVVDSSCTWLSQSVSWAGDVNDDGLDDALVSGGDNAGAMAGCVELVHGSGAGYASVSLTGEAGGDFAGAASDGAGDVNNDGYDDILVGAPQYASGAGKAYLLYGPVNDAMSLADSDAIFLGESAGDYCGATVSAAGDLDADGYDDILIGAMMSDAVAGDAGVVYVYFGGHQ